LNELASASQVDFHRLMKGRQKGRPTKWVFATIAEYFDIGKRGVKFEIWRKWKKKDGKFGTLTVSVGGLRWRPQNGKLSRQKSWDDVARFLKGS
jgi:hypothetical protein